MDSQQRHTVAWKEEVVAVARGRREKGEEKKERRERRKKARAV
jgi:hypothetical protein